MTGPSCGGYGPTMVTVGHGQGRRSGRSGHALAPLVAPATWLGATHLALEVVIGPVIGVVVLVGVCVGIVLVPVFGLGLLVLPDVLAGSTVLASWARRRLALLTGLVLPTPPTITGTWRERAEWRLRRSWREVTHHVLGIVGGPVLGTLVLAFGVAAVGLLGTPIWRPLTPSGTWPVAGPVGWVVMAGFVLSGVVLLLAWPRVVHGCVVVARAEAVLLLGPAPKDLLRRVDVLTRTRSAVVAAAEAERARIERDLHDGAQQRLVALAMGLGRARSRLDTDPAQARALLDDAHREAMTALAELRDLARGIAPSVLADRGLDAALSALAARSPVPVDVSVDPPVGPTDRTAESVAYFCVAEALTNVSKHAGARRASVAVRRSPGVLAVTISDDGVGGAGLVPGGGLAGLRDRVDAVDGRLSLDSPAGGPTALRLEVPCAS